MFWDEHFGADCNVLWTCSLRQEVNVYRNFWNATLAFDFKNEYHFATFFSFLITNAQCCRPLVVYNKKTIALCVRTSWRVSLWLSPPPPSSLSCRRSFPDQDGCCRKDMLSRLGGLRVLSFISTICFESIVHLAVFWQCECSCPMQEVCAVDKDSIVGDWPLAADTRFPVHSVIPPLSEWRRNKATDLTGSSTKSINKSFYNWQDLTEWPLNENLHKER